MHKITSTTARTAFIAALLASAAAYAQEGAGVPFAVVDINGDGFLDPAELLTIFDVAGLTLLSEDRNGDGLLSQRELRADFEEAEDNGVQSAEIDNRPARRRERSSHTEPDSSDQPTLSQTEDGDRGSDVEPADSDDIILNVERDVGGLERATRGSGQGAPPDTTSDTVSMGGIDRGNGQTMAGSDRTDRDDHSGRGGPQDDNTNLDSGIGNDVDRDPSNDPNDLEVDNPDQRQHQSATAHVGTSREVGNGPLDHSRGRPDNSPETRSASRSLRPEAGSPD